MIGIFHIASICLYKAANQGGAHHD